MTQPKFSIRHIPDPVLMPKDLIPGRLYFLEDEGVIKVNHGTSIATYGGKPGPRGAQGPQGLPGEPIPELQEQIDAVTITSWNLLEFARRLWSRYLTLTRKADEQGQDIPELQAGLEAARKELEELGTWTVQYPEVVQKYVHDGIEHLQGQVDNLTDADFAMLQMVGRLSARCSTMKEQLQEHELELPELEEDIELLQKEFTLLIEQSRQNTQLLTESVNEYSYLLQRQIDRLSEANISLLQLAYRLLNRSHEHKEQLALQGDQLPILASKVEEVEEGLAELRDGTFHQAARIEGGLDDGLKTLQSQVDALTESNMTMLKMIMVLQKRYAALKEEITSKQ